MKQSQGQIQLNDMLFIWCSPKKKKSVQVQQVNHNLKTCIFFSNSLREQNRGIDQNQKVPHLSIFEMNSLWQLVKFRPKSNASPHVPDFSSEEIRLL